MADWAIRPASVADVEAVAELRAMVLRADLERLGRYDGQRRQRLRDEQRVAYEPVLHVVERARAADHRSVVVVSGGPGSGKSVIDAETRAFLTDLVHVHRGWNCVQVSRIGAREPSMRRPSRRRGCASR